MPKGFDTSDDPRRNPSKVNPVTGKPYQGHITGDIRDTPEAQAAYAALADHLNEKAYWAERNRQAEQHPATQLKHEFPMEQSALHVPGINELSDEDFITQYGMIGPGGKIRKPPGAG